MPILMAPCRRWARASPRAWRRRADLHGGGLALAPRTPRHDAFLDQLLRRRGYRSIGSSLKFCLVAAGPGGHLSAHRHHDGMGHRRRARGAGRGGWARHRSRWRAPSATANRGFQERQLRRLGPRAVTLEALRSQRGCWPSRLASDLLEQNFGEFFGTINHHVVTAWHGDDLPFRIVLELIVEAIEHPHVVAVRQDEGAVLPTLPSLPLKRTPSVKVLLVPGERKSCPPMPRLSG